MVYGDSSIYIAIQETAESRKLTRSVLIPPMSVFEVKSSNFHKIVVGQTATSNTLIKVADDAMKAHVD